MRASYDASLVRQDNYIISGDRHHHLVNVIRINKGDDLLLLNGKGLKILTRVEEVLKKELRLTFISEERSDLPNRLSLALGIPKKDALDLCLKEAVELGFNSIYLIRSAYSQTRVPEGERLQNLLISALEQSNSSHLPEVVECGWDDVPWNNFEHSLLLDSQSKKRQNNDHSSSNTCLLIVGPEGGFSPEELTMLHQKPNVEILTLPTPILRTPTALAAGAGILLGRLLD